MNDRANNNEVSLQQLESNYQKSLVRYYREFTGKQDQALIVTLNKIPDDWREETPDSTAAMISEEQKERLSNFKKAKTLELRYETLFIHYFTTLEHSMMDLFLHSELSPTNLDEAVDAIETLTLELAQNTSYIKHLMLTLAKRQMSDVYYLLVAYQKYKKIKNETFEKNLINTLNEVKRKITIHRSVPHIISLILQCDELTKSFFDANSEIHNWRPNESKIKAFAAENRQEESDITVDDFLSGPVEITDETSSSRSHDFNLNYLIRVVRAGLEYLKMLKSDFLFLKYYYNGKDGKLFRLNFVTESLEEKMKKKAFSEDVYRAFHNIRENFILLKNAFEWRGLLKFGPERITYGDVILIIYRASKIVEHVYLRQARYDEVKEFRNNLLYYIEQEFLMMKPKEEF